MTHAKADILARIRLANLPPSENVVRDYRRAGALDAAGRTALLRQRLADYRAEVRTVVPAGAADAIAEACAARRARRLGVPAGLPADWRPDSLEIVEDRGLGLSELESLDGVVTGCTVAVAETGTFVLAGGPTEGRRALTLVPDLHVCVIRSRQIVELVPEALALLESLVALERRPLTFVSGPSATSDIELKRVEGVHGPRTLVAVILDEDER